VRGQRFPSNEKEKRGEVFWPFVIERRRSGWNAGVFFAGKAHFPPVKGREVLSAADFAWPGREQAWRPAEAGGIG